MTNAKIRLVPMRKTKIGRQQDNRRAFGFYARSVGAQYAKARFPNAESFLTRSDMPGGGWYAHPRWARRFFIRNEHGKVIGIIGFFTHHWVDKSQDAIFNVTPGQWQQYHRVRGRLHDRYNQLRNATEPLLVKEREGLERQMPTGLFRRGIINAQTIPIEIVQIPEIGIYLDPRFHGKGYGTEAVQAACQELKKRGFRFVYTDTETTNKAAIASVKKSSGWEEIRWTRPGRNNEGKEVERVFLVKKL